MPRREHICPPWCHRCPKLKNPDGVNEIMPGCMGTAARGTGLDYGCCTCERPKTKSRVIHSFDQWLAILEDRQQEITEEIAVVRAAIKEQQK